MQSAHMNKCKLCNFLSKDRKIFEAHLKQVHNHMQCTFCKFYTDNALILKDHWKTAHKVSLIFFISYYISTFSLLFMMIHLI